VSNVKLSERFPARIGPYTLPYVMSADLGEKEIYDFLDLSRMARHRLEQESHSLIDAICRAEGKGYELLVSETEVVSALDWLIERLHMVRAEMRRRDAS